MPVGANLRIAATRIDPSPAVATDAPSVEELFGGIIASLADASAEPGTTTEVSATPAPAVAEETGPAATADGDVSAVVEQLLALANRQASPTPTVPKADKPVGDEEPETAEAPAAEDTSTPLPILPSLTLDVTPKALPSKPDTVEPAKAKVELSAAQQPQVAVDQALDPEAQAREAQAPARRTDAAVREAFSSLEAIVKGLPARAIAAALPREGKQQSEREPLAPLQELKLAALTALMPTAAAAAPFDPARPADPLQAAAATPQVDTAQLVVERHLDMAHEGEWLDRLAKDIAQTAGTDKNPLRFRLNPETLGTLRVEITQERHGAAVRLTADTEAARSIIADAQPRLIAEARAQGIRIAEAHVDLGSQTQSGDPRRQNPAFEEPVIRTARSLRDKAEGDGKPTPGRSERYA